MNQDEALHVAQQLYADSGATDPELGAARVVSDLVKIAKNTSSPLAAVEAAEILCALDPDGWAQALTQTGIYNE